MLCSKNIGLLKILFHKVDAKIRCCCGIDIGVSNFIVKYVFCLISHLAGNRHHGYFAIAETFAALCRKYQFYGLVLSEYAFKEFLQSFHFQLPRFLQL